MLLTAETEVEPYKTSGFKGVLCVVCVLCVFMMTLKHTLTHSVVHTVKDGVPRVFALIAETLKMRDLCVSFPISSGLTELTCTRAVCLCVYASVCLPSGVCDCVWPCV